MNSETASSRVADVFDRAFIVLFALIMLFGMNYFQPNYGGFGLQAPTNMVVWFLIVLIIVLAGFKVIATGQLVVPRLLTPLSLCFTMMLVPGMVHYEPASQALLFRVLGLLGVLLLLWSFYQFRLGHRRLLQLALILCLSVLIQVVYGFVERFWAYTNPFPFIPVYADLIPKGIFQQPNTMTTFLATGALFSLFLLSQPGFARGALLLRLVPFLVAAGSGFLIFVIGSRTGLITLFFGLLLLAAARFRGLKRNGVASLLWLAVFVAAGVAGALDEGKSGNASIERTMSKMGEMTEALGNKAAADERMPMYQLSLQAYADKPWTGHGIGSFTRVFQPYKAAYNEQYPDTPLRLALTVHPHNEVLFWMVESGTGALLGMVGFVLFYLVRLGRRGWRPSLIWLGLVMPIGLQTQLSYPFWLSTTHLLLFVFLVYWGGRGDQRCREIGLSHPFSRSLQAALLSVVLLMGLFSWHVLVSAADIRRFLEGEFRDTTLLERPASNPVWRQTSETYGMIAGLFMGKRTGRIDLVKLFLTWGEERLKYDDNPLIYFGVIEAHRSLGNHDKSRRLLDHALRAHPRNKSLKQLQQLQQQMQQTAQ